MIVNAPEVQVHWIGDNPYFGVLCLHNYQWLWQLYDGLGKKLRQARVKKKTEAVDAIRHAAHEEAKARPEKIWPED